MTQKNYFRLHYLASLLTGGFINYKLSLQLEGLHSMGQVCYMMAMFCAVFYVLGLLLARFTNYKPRWVFPLL